ncbi:MAG: Aspartate aminotransferase [Alphaproteobacteria bacterium MarineAlpha5_Bin8]|mgnify:CR=1 FL=1|nr:MAG: Aspartate aminotransferase [Alphaproteobacteria bacterium MarineAlpha5_Bin7]PPR48116.1 MAG: Aspartate aminotransferase [Alphaproteobacteria bacterium MarineAlpha5_Bin8]PPR54306.1 MAG: Aspartate aminotransferase [Alphaproteobacteria bacterium MarineAlpha5_Bin6]|tara:strand:+ start:724 stop:1926 length:1203 start_codon:yes stop_codon:yes gene_type:complete
MNLQADRLQRIKPSMTVAINVKANALRAQGKDVLVLAAGEPDFDTPVNIINAAKSAMDAGKTRYVPGKGTPDLQKAIIDKFERENNLKYSPEEIMVGVGGKHIIYNALMATLNPKDEVIIPTPYWVSYPDIVMLAEGKPVFVECDVSQNFKITADQLEKYITNKTKWLMLNSPSNPTGALYSYDELKSLSEVLLKHPNVLILTDDIYEKIIYDGNKFNTIASVEPQLKERVLTLNGVSKAYCMTGWRLGYCGGPKEIISGMNKIQSQSTTSTSSITMAASVEALNGKQDFIEKHNIEFIKRRDLVVDKINKIEGLSCNVPAGAFYVYPNCSGLIGKKTPQNNVIKNDEELMKYLLESEGVAGVHGEAFGLSPYFRLSYATNEKILIEACNRIERACKKLS